MSWLGPWTQPCTYYGKLIYMKSNPRHRLLNSWLKWLWNSAIDGRNMQAEPTYFFVSIPFRLLVLMRERCLQHPKAKRYLSRREQIVVPGVRAHTLTRDRPNQKVIRWSRSQSTWEKEIYFTYCSKVDWRYKGISIQPTIVMNLRNDWLYSPVL